jgi:hypothetical protein
VLSCTVTNDSAVVISDENLSLIIPAAVATRLGIEFFEETVGGVRYLRDRQLHKTSWCLS